MRLPLAELVESMGGVTSMQLDGVYVGAFVIDSRRAHAGTLFFALRGERVDGHDFVSGAIEAGAVAVIEHPIQGLGRAAPVILVSSVEAAMLDAARLVRARLSQEKIVAVTGSCGKTSTKEFLRAALHPTGEVGATSGNRNNHLGMPLTLGSFTPEMGAYVVELGMNHFGEIDLLASIVRPHVGVITSIAPVHLEGVGTIDGVREAKGELLDHITEGGTAVLPAEEHVLIDRAWKKKLRVLTFGDEGADFAVGEVRSTLGRVRFALTTPDQTVTVLTPAGGIHQAHNSAAALAAATALGVPLAEAVEALSRATLPGKRSKLERYGSLHVFNDCYNASPGSMEAVITLVEESWDSSLHLLLGEMRELGDSAPKFHEALGLQAANSRASSITYVGAYTNAFVRGVTKAGGQCHCAPTPQDAARHLLSLVSPGDLILIKGSRGVHLEEALPILQSN